MYQRSLLKYLVIGLVSFLTLGFGVFYIFQNKENIFEKKNSKVSYLLTADLDSDADGVPDAEERKMGTNPYNPDSDEDGFSDKVELAAGYDPLVLEKKDKFDADDDGLNDEEEKKFETNPNLADSDFDGVTDGAEIIAGTDPLKTDLSYFLKIAESKAASEETKKIVAADNQKMGLTENNETDQSAKTEQNNGSAGGSAVDRNDLGDYLLGLGDQVGVNTGLNLNRSSVSGLEQAMNSNNLSSFQANIANFAQAGNLDTASLTTQIKVELAEIKDEELKIKDNYSKEDLERYFANSILMLSRELPFSNEESFSKFAMGIRLQDKTDMARVKKIMEKISAELKNTEVPKEDKILKLHKKSLAFTEAAVKIVNDIERVDFDRAESLYTLTNLMPQVNYLVNSVFYGEIMPEAEKAAGEYGVTSLLSKVK